MVFQLPYVPFPENPPVQQMSDYDHLRGALHSRTLKWSYPTMRGRWGDTWQRAIAQKRVDAAKTALEAAKKAQEDLEDEARHAGALPGWLR